MYSYRLYLLFVCILNITLPASAQSSGGSGGSGGSDNDGGYGSTGSTVSGGGSTGSGGGGGNGCYYGCTDPASCNYSPVASCDDGSCSGTRGCTNSKYCNYNINATCDDGSCYGYNTDTCRHYTGIDDITATGIKIFPNPPNDIISIQSDDYVINNIEIFNMLAQPVAVKMVNANFYQLETGGLAGGSYLLLLRADEGTFKKIFMVMHE